MENIDEEVKKYIKMFLKSRPDTHLAWQLAEKYNMEDFFNKQCQRYSILPEKAKQKVTTCRVLTKENLLERRKGILLLRE